MKMGHTTGKRREKPTAQAWFKPREEELIRRVEAAWQVTHPSPTVLKEAPNARSAS